MLRRTVLEPLLRIVRSNEGPYTPASSAGTSE
ncbi:hypothetical protein ACVWZD_007270 [Streptomyces sp. TE3672]